MKRYVLVLFLFLSYSGYAQNTINNYKYVVVPEKFNSFKQIDQYSLNSLTKALLQEKGFTVYFDNAEMPAEVANNKCQTLNADLLEKSGMFTTELTLLLKDCQGNILYKSKTGKSREKEYKAAYNTNFLGSSDVNSNSPILMLNSLITPFSSSMFIAVFIFLILMFNKAIS